MLSTGGEVWKLIPIEGNDKYLVSNMGNVYSNHRGGKVLKGGLSHGYRTVTLCVNEKQKCYKIATLVTMTFIRMRREEEVVRHLNDVKTDDRLENLALGSRLDNYDDAVRNGAHVRHLSKEDVVCICKSDLNYQKLARKFEVGKSTIQGIKNRITYTYITNDLVIVNNEPCVRKLTALQVKEVYFSDKSNRELGRIYKVDPSVISLIKNKKSYKDITKDLKR